MSSDPNQRILDRHTPKVENRDFFNLVDRVLTLAVDKSTRIFARCWTTTPDTLVGQVPLFLHRHVLEMVDAVHILILESASAPARLQLRSVFEAICYLEFMTRSDRQLRTKAYIVGSYMWGLQSARRMLKGSGERKVFLEELQSHALADPEIGRKLITKKSDVKKYEEFLESELLSLHTTSF